MRGLRQRLAAIERRQALQQQSGTVEEQLRKLARTAHNRLQDATPEQMAQLYDLLDLDLIRTGARRFEGTGSIPIHEAGDIWENAPQGL